MLYIENRMINIKPLPYEGYHEWKRRRRMVWYSKLSYTDRRSIDEFITKLSLFIEENKQDRRSGNG